MGVPIQVWRARIGGFAPNRKASRSPKFRATGSHGWTMFSGAPTVTICLLCACAILLLASGIEPNPGPDTPRVPTPCDAPLVTPQRRQNAKSASDDAVNCMQCNISSPDQSTIKCSMCSESIHLGCLKAGKYLECQGWRKEPPRYIGQLFNSPYFKFICHSCVSSPSSPILQDDITITMRSIEHKLDILTSTMAGSVPDKETRQTTTSTPIHTIPSSTGEIAKALWTHIERKQHEHSDADDDKRSVVVTGAPYNDTLRRIDRNRNDTTFARELVGELGIDPAHIQRVFRFPKHKHNDRPPLMKITFLSEATQEEALMERSVLRDIPDHRNVYIRPSLSKVVRDLRNILYYGASHTTFDPDTLVKCVYNSRSENFELRYLIHDDARNIDRVDWKRKVDYSAATYATWKAAVACRRAANGAARNSSETQVKQTR